MKKKRQAEEFAQRLEAAIKCIEEDDLDSLKEIVPDLIPIDVRIKESGFLLFEGYLNMDWSQDYPFAHSCRMW
jgi:hypothetical protein